MLWNHLTFTILLNNTESDFVWNYSTKWFYSICCSFDRLEEPISLSPISLKLFSTYAKIHFYQPCGFLLQPRWWLEDFSRSRRIIYEYFFSGKKKRQLHPSMSIRRSVLCTAVVVVHELVQGSPIHCLDIIQGIFQTRVELLRVEL